MTSLDRRLRLLERTGTADGCVLCEIAKLNSRVRGDAPAEEQCLHPRSLTWADVLTSIEDSPRSRAGLAGTPGAWRA